MVQVQGYICYTLFNILCIITLNIIIINSHNNRKNLFLPHMNEMINNKLFLPHKKVMIDIIYIIFITEGCNDRYYINFTTYECNDRSNYFYHIKM